ncbi:MAG TPA: DUF4271 domain-containing protein, partial [Saprospiraceae bacterium]|nr:DUF4271 domain-containing protein [Saprospiraceae bacterium]
ATAAVNPFELKARLAALQASAATTDTLVNPFDVVPHRAPGAAAALAENKTPVFQPFSVLPRGRHMPANALFTLLVALVGFLAFAVVYNRTVVLKAWRGFLSDNALTIIQREAAGFTGTTPYYLLYASFVLNAGVFIFLVIRFFRKDTFDNLGFLLVCLLLATVIFLSKHIMLRALAWLFPVKNEVRRYNFLIIVFNCVLGLFLLPCNLLLAFDDKSERQAFLVFWMLGLVVVFYLYRGLRSSAIGAKFLAVSQFHFLLYLCTVEIAPVLFLVKLAILQM